MKILFVTHDSSRTGAPMVLLHFLKWIQEYQPLDDVTVISIRGGELNDLFKESSRRFYDLSIMHVGEESLFRKVKKTIFKKLDKYRPLPNPKDGLIYILGKKRFDLIYANSVVSLPFAQKIKQLSPISKLVVHVHELNSIISMNFPDFRKSCADIDQFIAVSELVKQNLIDNFSCNEEKIETIHGFTQVENIRPVETRKDFVVGGAGTVHWRKGSDIFIQVARYIKDKYPLFKIKFEWVGFISREERIILDSDIEKSELTEIVTFLGSKETPLDYFSNFDIFLLTSREDPFPLVAIEAGMLGKPIICFEKATGTTEVLKQGGGVIVPYMDIEAMAGSIVQYYMDREKIEKDGAMAKKLFSGFTPEKICPNLYTVLIRACK